MSDMKIRSSKKDYNTALEGVGYARVICNNKFANIEQQITLIIKHNLMQGETGEIYCKKLQSVTTILSAVISKFDSLAKTITAVCNKNGAFLNNSVMDDFDTVSKKFAQLSKQVESFKGKK